MAFTRKQKEEMLNELKSILKDSASVAFVNFHGLSVSDATALRSSLRDAGVGYKVAKKTLTKLALDGAAEGEIPELPGELALAYGEETAPAREIHEFAKKHPEGISLLGGIFEGKFLSRDEIMEIASIPGLDVLRGMFVNIINSPIQRFAIAMGQIAEKKS